MVAYKDLRAGRKCGQWRVARVAEVARKDDVGVRPKHALGVKAASAQLGLQRLRRARNVHLADSGERLHAPANGRDVPGEAKPRVDDSHAHADQPA